MPVTIILAHPVLRHNFQRKLHSVILFTTYLPPKQNQSDKLYMRVLMAIVEFFIIFKP